MSIIDGEYCFYHDKRLNSKGEVRKGSALDNIYEWLQ